MITTQDQSSRYPITRSRAGRALQALLAGNTRFINNQSQHPNQSLNRLTDLSQNQNPFATILTCSDSRVSPEIVFDQGVGDLFIIRVAGNIINSTELGSVEYGVSVLQTPILLVLGHSNCGAVKAALSKDRAFGHIETLVQAIQPAVEHVKHQPGDTVKNAVRANVLWQTESLRRSNIIARLLEESRLEIVGAYFDLTTGKMTILNILTVAQTSIEPNYINTF